MINVTKYLLISLISAILSLILVELFLELSKKEKNSKLTYYLNKKKSNNNYTLAYPPILSLRNQNKLDHLGGISHSKTIVCNENGYFSEFLSDRYGFNNPDNEWDKKGKKIYLIGDSFVFGSCVNRPNDIASNLRLLQDNTIINLGYGGNGPLLNYATFIEYIENKNYIDLIYFFYSGNDLKDLKYEIKQDSLNKYLKKKNYKKNFIDNQEEINLKLNEKIKTKINQKDKSYLIKDIIIFKNIKSLISKFIFTEKKNNLVNEKEEFLKIIELIKNQLEINQSNFYFVYLPSFKELMIKKNDYYDLIIKLNKIDINVIDLNKEINSHLIDIRKIYAKNNKLNHFNEDGYKIISQILSEKIF